MRPSRLALRAGIESRMNLSDLPLPDVRFEPRFAGLELSGIASDSRKVKPGFLFVAVPGSKADGLGFVPQALAAGAASVMAERKPDLPEHVAFVETRNVRRALALAA